MSHDAELATVSTRWILLSAIGLTAGIGAGGALAGPVEALLGVMFVLPAVGVSAGLCLGGAQLVANGSREATSIAWIATTAFGFAIGLTLGTVLVEVLLVDMVGLRAGHAPSDLVALAFVGGLAGAVTGSVQLLPALRKGTDASAGWWTVGSALGLALGAAVGGGIAYLAVGTIRSLAGIALVGLGAGAGIGATLGRTANPLP